VTLWQVLEGKKVNLDALRKRLDFLEDVIRGAPDGLRDVLLCDPNAEMLHAVLLGLAAESLLFCKTPDELAAYLNRKAVEHFGNGASAMFAVYHEETYNAHLFEWKQVETVMAQNAGAFDSVEKFRDSVSVGTRPDVTPLVRLPVYSEAYALLFGEPVVSVVKEDEKTEYAGYSPVKDFMWALYSRLMDKPENQALKKALDDYEKNGFRQMVREPDAFEKRRQQLEDQLKSAFDPAVGTIDAILDNQKEAEGYVAESHEVGPVRKELYGQFAHARYLFDKIIIYAELDWLYPPNRLFRYSHYRLDHEGTVQMARMDDALHEAGYFKRMELLKKEHCR